ncbi:Outer envelope protein 61, chloroplastic [Apostasia shenzhenica]|uniref:Outer envelope protein 61, chloroplastic n=1 Tax=Apostasia shenzhenica TaxID=1088818 RepID=A0A2H9ZR98_9ASPA|nr:Outer envelope protein 61, chloroplastic [Apostasia shenzhenica]
MFNAMMDPELMRLAQEQMRKMPPAELARMQQQELLDGVLAMFSNPEFMKLATESMKSMKPEDLKLAKEQLKHSKPEDMVKLTEKMASASPEELASLKVHADAQIIYQANAAEMLKKEGNDLHARGQYHGAASKYLRVLKNDPKNVKALYRRGQAYKELGKLEAALSDLTRAHQFSPEDETIEGVLRDAKLLKDGGLGTSKCFIEEIEEEETRPVPTQHGGSVEYTVTQPVYDGECSENGGSYETLSASPENLQAFKDNPEAIRLFQKYVSKADPGSLSAMGLEGMSPDIIKAATEMIGSMKSEELQKMLEVAAAFKADGPNFPSMNHNGMTPELIKMASEKLSGMSPEELKKMYEVSSSINTDIAKAASGSNSQCPESGSQSSVSVVSEVRTNSSGGLSCSSNTVQPPSSSPTSSVDLQETMRNSMNDPAMRQMLTSMMKNMSPEMMANMSQQFGMKLSKEDAAKAQQTMTSLSPEDLDRMMRWAERAQRGVETPSSSTNWALLVDEESSPMGHRSAGNNRGGRRDVQLAGGRDPCCIDKSAAGSSQFHVCLLRSSAGIRLCFDLLRAPSMAKWKVEKGSGGTKKKKKKGGKLPLSGPAVAAMKSSKQNRPNPFETLWSRRKFNVLGKKKGKGEEVRIGLSRSLAVEKRNKTLMKEYEESSKSSKFIDRRLGEKDDTLQEFDKAILRLQRQRQHLSAISWFCRTYTFCCCELKEKRARKYNLSDDEEDDSIIPQPHFLSDVDDFNEQVPPDEDGDIGTAGISDLTTRDLYLPPEQRSVENDFQYGTEKRHKSNKQAYAEVIAKDKFNWMPYWLESGVYILKMYILIAQAKRAEEREEIGHEIAALNKLTDEMDDRLNALSSLDRKHSSEKHSDEKQDAYKITMGELHFEPRAHPSERTKTPEETAQEEKEALEKKEKERLNRMRPTDDDDDYDRDGAEDEVKSSSRMNRYVSGDDLGDSFSLSKGIGNERGWVDDIYEREENEGNHEQGDTSSDGSESSEDDQEECDDADVSDEGITNEVDYDNLSSMKDWEQSDDDDLGVEEAQETDEIDTVKVGVGTCKADSANHKLGPGGKDAQVKEEIPYVIQVPTNLKAVCSLLDNRSDVEVVEIIRRVRAYNSISLGTENRRKMQVFYGVLLNYFAFLGNQKPLNVKIINSLVKPLVEMGAEVPYFASVCARERLIHIRAQFCENIKIPGKCVWPSLKTLNLLRLWSLTFPCSDFRHVVMTPVVLLMCEYLMRCPITSGRDIAIGSFLCSMLLSVTKQSQKYCPEVIGFLQFLLISCTEENSEITQQSVFQNLMELNSFTPWLCINDDGCHANPIDFFMVLEMEPESPFFASNNFKASILSHTIKLLKEFINMYERLSSFPEIFLPIADLLRDILHRAKLPGTLRASMEDVNSLVTQKTNQHQMLRQPLQMRRQRPEPIKLLNPKFEENFVKGVDYDPDRERAQRKKLKKLLKKEAKGAVRELRKDNHFVFKLKERDRLLQEEERAEKYGKALAFLQEQEHSFKSGQLGKGRKRRR